MNFIFQVIKEVLIKDRLADTIGLAIDEIDQIVLLKLIKPIKYKLLIKNLTLYLDDDVLNEVKTISKLKEVSKPYLIYHPIKGKSNNLYDLICI